MAYQFKVAGLSDVGLVRENNEDVWGQLTGVPFYALADGMGGHRAGEVASRETVRYLCRHFETILRDKGESSLDELGKELEETIRDVNTAIFTMGTMDDELRGMGTTLCAIYLCDEGAVMAHVGDSRIYRFRRNRLVQMTQDHSLYNDLIRRKKLEEGGEDTYQYKNIITKAIGTDPEVDPEVRVEELEDQDIFLLCSDGLTDLLADWEMAEILVDTKGSLDVAVHALTKRAKEKGGYDNITVVLAQAIAS